MSDFTRILDRAQGGDPKAADELLILVYDDLRRLAAAKMAHEKPGQTLQPTGLVHEAWLRITGPNNHGWEKRRHFFCPPGPRYAPQKKGPKRPAPFLCPSATSDAPDPGGRPPTEEAAQAWR